MLQVVRSIRLADYAQACHLSLQTSAEPQNKNGGGVSHMSFVFVSEFVFEFATYLCKPQLRIRIRIGARCVCDFSLSF